MMMKIKPVLKESFLQYRKNLCPLFLALLVEVVLRAMALSPLLFRTDEALKPLAYLAIPLYLLIVLPARQNYAIALQDMLRGGSVFSVQLISTQDYFRKLWRGLKGTLCMLAWSALTIAGVGLLYAAVKGLVDAITLMRIFKTIGGSVVVGVMIVAAAMAASMLLIVVGCAVHSGSRHAAAMGSKALLKGHRMRMTALWFVGLLLVLPFAAVVAATVGSYVAMLIEALKNMNLQISADVLNARQIAVLAVSAVVLLYPVLPLKNLLPAVYLHMLEESRHDAA